MKTRQRLPARFGPETGFEVRPTPAATFRAAEESRLEQLKRQLLWEQLENATGADLNARLRRAANEAAALAWTTKVPLLLFPVLFEELAGLAVQQAARQQTVHQRSRMLLAA